MRVPPAGRGREEGRDDKIKCGGGLWAGGVEARAAGWDRG